MLTPASAPAGLVRTSCASFGVGLELDCPGQTVGLLPRADVARKIAERDGIAEGLVCAYGALIRIRNPACAKCRSGVAASVAAWSSMTSMLKQSVRLHVLSAWDAYRASARSNSCGVKRATVQPAILWRKRRSHDAASARKGLRAKKFANSIKTASVVRRACPDFSQLRAKVLAWA